MAHLIFTQSLLSGLAIMVSRSSLPKNGGALSLMCNGTRSSSPTGM